MNPLIGIVIVNYNGQKFQNDCIKCILNNTYDNYKIIIVDNASTDDSMKLLSDFNDDRIIKLFCDENYGVAKGNNIGIKKSMELGTDCTLLLNNDTIFDSNLLKEMVTGLEKNPVVTPKMYYKDSNKIWYAGGGFSKLKCNSQHYHFNEIDKFNYKNTLFDYAPTTCMLISNDVFNAVGLMDETYFMYCDDTDFCFRLNNNKIKILLLKDVAITHLVSQSSGGSESKTFIYYSIRNKLYFMNKFKKHFFRGFIWINFMLKKTKAIVKRNKYMKMAIDDYKNNAMGRRELK